MLFRTHLWKIPPFFVLLVAYLFIKYELAHDRGKSWDGPSSAFFLTSVLLLFEEHLLIIYIFVFYDDDDDDDEIKIKLN